MSSEVVESVYEEDRKRNEIADTLLMVAQTYRVTAYAPYSHYLVGASVRAVHPETGDVMFFGGANVENASYGMTICAERVAIFNAVTLGYTTITHMGILTENGGMSCGACRQVEYEFNPNLIIYSWDLDLVQKDYYLSGELPHAFGPEYLKF
jgi:cytidine deaminase